MRSDGEPSAGAASARRGDGAAMGGLFGRGLLYVVVWAFQLLSSTIVSPVLAHLMGPGQFGSLASAIALHQILIILSLAGLDQALVVQKSRDHDLGAARGLLAVGTLLATAVTLAAGVTAPLWGPLAGFHGMSLLLPTVLWTAPGAAVQLVLAMLMSEDRFRAFAAVSALSAVGGQLFGIGLLLMYGPDAGIYAWGGVISQFSAMAVGFAVARPRLGGLAETAVTRNAVLLGLPLMLSGISAFVLNAGDRVIVQRVLGPVEVGRYQVAYTVGNVVILLIGFIRQSWTPRILAVSDPVERWRLIGHSRDELYRLLLPVFLGVNLAAPMLLRIVAPPSFRPGSLLLVVCLVALSAFPVVASGATGSSLLSLSRTRPLALAAAAAAVANLALNLVLVPIAGIPGSAAATVLSFTVQALLQRWSLPKQARGVRTPVPLVLALIVTGLVALVFVHVPGQGGGWLVVRVAGCAACAAWAWMRLRRARTPPGVDAGDARRRRHRSGVGSRPLTGPLHREESLR